jgi:predicted RNA binding protein YcfA (HicA-like mRNA interferase family)
MPKLYSSAFIIKILLSRGFLFVSQKGSHMKFRKDEGGKVLTTIVPAPRKEIPVGTFHSILKQSNLSRSDFEK